MRLFLISVCTLFVLATVTWAQTTSPITVPPFTYRNCLTDATGHLLATGYPTTSSNNYFIIPADIGSLSPAEYCISQCHMVGTLFAAVTNASVCTCGVFFHSSDITQDSSCNANCGISGSGGYTCGGVGFASVFQIALEACPTDSNYYMHRGICYRFVDTPANFTWAEMQCESDGAYLASIDSAQENNFILSLPNAISSSNIGMDFWAGGIYYGPANGFEWITGYLPSYFDWKESEPQTSIRNENCLDVASATTTPIGGTWSSQSCQVSKMFMCKKFVNASMPSLIPRVQIVGAGAATACVPPTNVALDHTRHLEAHFTLDADTIDNITNTAADSSPYHRNAQIHSYNNFATGYQFERNELTWGSSLRFDGNTTIVVPVGWDAMASDALTVTAWVRMTRQQNPTRHFEIIVSKDASDMPHFGDSFAWALAVIDNDQFCFTVGDKSACTPQSQGPTHYDTWRFVAGVYDGISLDIFIDGVQAGTTAAMNVPLVHNYSLPIVIGGQAFPINFSTRVTFQGLLDDVRIYSAALPVGDLQYLQECELNPFLINVIEAYANTALTLTLMGHDLMNYHRLGLSTNGCANGTAFNTSMPPIFMLGFTTIRRILQFPSTQIVSGDYDICFTTPNNPTVYEGGLNITLRVVQINSLNGTQRKAVINTDNVNGSSFVSASVSLQGVNLHDRTVVLLSPFQTCSYSFGSSIAVLNNSSPDGTTATLMIFHASIANSFYYLCWAGSFEDAANVNRVVATGLTIQLVGSQYTTKIVADNDGTTSVIAQNIIDGFAVPNGNYFLDCNSLNDTTNTYFLEVTMGSFVDFLIPAPGYTACDVLLGKSASAPWGGSTLYLASYYSPINPLSREYDGSTARLIPAGTFGSLGGSASGFPKDGRQQLSQWGTINYPEVGGCCYSVGHQERAWFQPYTIVAHSYNQTSVYFQVDERPSIVFPDEVYSIRVKLVDIHGYHRNISGCNFVLTQDGTPSTVFSPHCDYTYRVINARDFSTFRATGTIADPSSMYTIVNRNDVQFIVTTDPLPLDSQLLSSGVNVTRMLSFRTDDGLTSVMSASGQDASTSMFEPSDALIEPVEEQPMTAVNYITKPVQTYNWVWKLVEDDTGLFGQQVSQAGGIQYFAFALYAAVQQNIAINGGCIGYIYGWDPVGRGGRMSQPSYKGCAMYIDGAIVERQDEFSIASGWHQVVVKLYNGQPTTADEGFFINFDGSGLATNIDKPLGAPDGSSQLVLNRPIQQFLWLRSNPTVSSSFDVNGLPNGMDEGRVFPQEDLDWFPLATPSSGLILNTPINLNTYQMALFYFATGIYATSFGSATFTITNAVGAIRIYQDGEVIAGFPADLNGPTRTVTIRFYPGWSQLLFKVSASNHHMWAFQMVLTEVNQVILFAEPAIPEMLPASAVDFNAQPLGQALALLSQGSGVYALSYDSTSTTAPAAIDPSYTQVNTSRFNAPGDFEYINQVPFLWSPVNALDAATGRFGEARNDGGGYNRYYSFALYVTRNSDTLNATLHHHEGTGIWFDGQFIRGSVNASDADAGMYIRLRNVSRGWHTVHIRLQSANSLKFLPIPTADHGLAQQICWNSGLNLCFRDFDVCPLNVARSDIGIPVSGSSWAALGQDTEWIQVGSGDNKEALCGTEVGDSTVSSSSSGSSFNAACCGMVKPPYFTFTVDGVPSRTRVGWAASVPPQAPREPFIFTTAGPDSESLTITIFSNQSGVQLLYTVNHGVYPSTSYTGPFTVRFAGLVRAIARLNGVDSVISEVFVSVRGNLTISRDVCSKGPDCFVQVSRSQDINAAFGDWLAVVVDTSDSSASSQVLENVITSSSYVQNSDLATSAFTNFIAIDSNNVIRIPGTFLARPSISQVTVVLFESSATTRNIAGTAVQVAIAVSALAPTVTTVYRNVPFAPISLSGGFIGGDRLAFPELFIDPASWQARYPNEALCSVAACNAIGTDAFFGFRVAHYKGGDTFLVNTTFPNNNQVTSVTCACVESFGELMVGRNDYANYAVASVVKLTTPISVLDFPTPDASRASEIITFGPRVVTATHDTSDGSQPLRPLGPGRDNRVWVYGNFPSANTADYSATFMCASGVALTTDAFNCSTTVPTALVADVAPGAMTLHVHAPNNGLGISGLWTLRIAYGQSFTNVPINYESSFYVAVLHPTPNITAADGECARASTSCQHNSLVTFIGSNFNPVDIHRNKIDLIDPSTQALSRTAFCHVEAATESSVTCRLFFLVPPSSTSSVDVVARVEAIPAPWQSGEVFASSIFDSHNTLRFAAQGAGWSGDVLPGTIAPTPTPSGGDGYAPGDDSGKSINAGIIAAIVCGTLLLLIIVGAIVVVKKFDLVPKQRGSGQMDEVEQSLNEQV